MTDRAVARSRPGRRRVLLRSYAVLAVVALGAAGVLLATLQTPARPDLGPGPTPNLRRAAPADVWLPASGCGCLQADALPVRLVGAEPVVVGVVRP